MCLVEIEGQPKLQPSCVFPAQDGMVVQTDSHEASLARRSVIEFLLLNHPLDCPICDAAGQCMLQDYAFETGQLKSRYAEAKVVLGRDRIAEDILYFGDRCILCTRCVRFMEDVAGDNTLIVAQRGHTAYIDTFPGRDLESEFRGNIVDVCPVGALVHEDFVFKARAWDMDNTPSVCPGCSTGCNIDINVTENQIVRVKPRYNPEVNAYWMCDHGRKHLVMANRGLRTEAPLIRRNGDLEAVGWSEALAWTAERLRAENGGSAVTSAGEACESLFYLRKLLSALSVGSGTFRVTTGEQATLSGFPRLKLRSQRAANVAGAELFGFEEAAELPPGEPGKLLVVMGDRLTEVPEGYGARASFFLYIGSHLSTATGNATAVLPVTTFAEMDGTFVNHEGRLQRFHQALQPPGVARPAWMVIGRILSRLGAADEASDVQSAFDAMASETQPMEGLSWAGLGLKGATLSEAGTPVLAVD
jgi:NADH-quinone oxidoreductase subunit G